MVDQPQSEFDVDSLIDGFSVDDLINNYHTPRPGEPGAPHPPISGPDGDLPQPTVTQQGKEQPTLLHRLAVGLNAQDLPMAVGIGAAKAAVATKDVLTGGIPSEDQKWAPRKWIIFRNSGNLLRARSMKGAASAMRR